jgi:hypothetical protein
MTHADTDGLLDKCRCLAPAGFEDAGEGFVRARCTECCEQTEPAQSKYQCMLWWNTARRREKRKDQGK